MLGQCYVQPQAKYYVAVRSGTSAAGGDDVKFKVTATLVPARLELGAKVSASVCDQRYLHFYWQLDSALAVGAVKSTVTRTPATFESSARTTHRLPLP